MNSMADKQPNIIGVTSPRNMQRCVDAANYVENLRLGNSKGALKSFIDATVIKVKNVTGGDLNRGSVLQVDDYLPTGLEDFDRRFFWFDGIAPADLSDGVFGCLRQPVPSGEYGDLQLTGACIARVLINDTDHKYADVEEDETRLNSAASGPYRILSPVTGTGEAEYIVIPKTEAAGARNFVQLSTPQIIRSANASGSEPALQTGEVRSNISGTIRWWRIMGSLDDAKLEYLYTGGTIDSSTWDDPILRTTAAGLYLISWKLQAERSTNWPTSGSRPKSTYTTGDASTGTSHTHNVDVDQYDNARLVARVMVRKDSGSAFQSIDPWGFVININASDDSSSTTQRPWREGEATGIYNLPSGAELYNSLTVTAAANRNGVVVKTGNMLIERIGDTIDSSWSGSSALGISATLSDLTLASTTYP